MTAGDAAVRAAGCWLPLSHALGEFLLTPAVSAVSPKAVGRSGENNVNMKHYSKSELRWATLPAMLPPGCVTAS